MRRIFKYPIAVEGTQTVTAPKGARWLTVQTQRNSPCLWAMVDDEQPDAAYEVLTRGTGHDASEVQKADYVGTYQLDGGAFVFHVFVS